jgi:hypothetical protein
VKVNSTERPALRGHRSAKEIIALLQEHRRGGLSLLAFARQRQLCYSSLQRWRSRYGTGAKVPASPEPETGPGFVPVQIQAEPGSGDYVLSLPGGRSLRIPPRFESEGLRRVLTVLQGLP